MSELVDARGLACPAPVVKTRSALKGGATDIEVLVDNPTARDNVCRFASSQGFETSVIEEAGYFRIGLTGTGALPKDVEEEMITCEPAGGKTVVVLSSDIMGRGDDELGKILIKAFLNTLAESDPPPWKIVLFNRGVLLAAQGEDTVEALSNLSSLGVEILVCGTCLDFLGIKDKVAVGTVSNMYDILTTMLTATNSITV
jgi:selenium metabolism protein YedF